MTALGYANGDEYGTVTLAVDPVPPGTSYRDAVAEAQRRGAKLVACNSIQSAESDNSGTLLSGLVPVNLQGLTGRIGLDCRPAEESDFPA
ncbi:hydrophobin family protein [Nocardia sp. NPDC057030]|uniref:hydrophobin family protein n=1 Tax=unclassified Nocardia TaxID=2637762 RepID=UPI0036266168